jgi:hypothetical protein
VRRDREGEAQILAGRVALDGRLEHVLDAGEFDDVVEAPADLGALQSQDSPVQEYVLAPVQLRMEPRSDLEQRTDAAAHPRHAAGRDGDPREHLQQRRLPGAVASDQPDHLALVDGEAHVAKRPEVALGPDAVSPERGERLAERHVVVGTEPVSLAHLVNLDRAHGQMRSANRR